MDEERVELLEGLPFSEYLKDTRLSRSLLWAMKTSPWHFRRAIDAPKEDTREMLLGRAYHTLVLEPEKFEAQYFTDRSPGRPSVDGRTKAGKALLAEWADTCVQMEREDNPKCDKEKLSPMEFAMLTQMAHHARDNAQFESIMKADPLIESTIFWTDPLTDIDCKARLDLWSPGNLLLVDIKTVADASPSAFAWACARYGYHLQDAFYSRAVQALTGEVPAPMVFLCSEKTEPYHTEAYVIDDESRHASLDLLEGLLLKVDECSKAGEWPRFSPGIKTVSIPWRGF